MFTGIVEGVGSAVAIADRPQVRVLEIEVPPQIAEDTVEGASLSVAGACLTVVKRDGVRVIVELVPETLSRTHFGELTKGQALNLERPLAVGARLGGHFVLGHVDGLARIEAFDRLADTAWLTIRPPHALLRFLPEKAFLALDGVSLTIARRTGLTLSVALVPETLRRTTLGQAKPGDVLHLEIDPLARYLDSLLAEQPEIKERRSA